MAITTYNTSASSLYEKNTALDQLRQYRAYDWGTGKTSVNIPFESVSWEEKYWTEKVLWDQSVQTLQDENTKLKEEIVALKKGLEGFLGFAI